MFGKGGGALGAWIKEFCQLVFIQTLQAFIYAIAVGLIMKMNVAAMENSDAASVLGFMCVICLTAIFKVEDILRKILGFGSTKADHGNAVKSIAKTAFAMQIGKRVLDNGKKIVGGTKNVIEGSIDKGKAKAKFDRRVKAYKMDNGIDDSGEGAALPSSSPEKPNTVLASSQNDEKARLLADAKRSRMLALTETDPLKHKALMKEAEEYEARANAMSGMLAGTSNNGVQVAASTSKASRGKDFYQKMQAFEDQYKDDVKAANKKRRDGLRTLSRGVLESAGAVVGGTAGGILGFADGNVDEGLQGIVAGAGIGDAIGSGAVTVATAPGDFVEWSANTVSDAIKNHNQAVKERHDEEVKEAQAHIDDMNKQVQGEITRINKNAEKARSQLQKDVDNSVNETVREIDNLTRRTKSAVTKSYKSRHGGIKQLDNGLKGIEKHIETSTSNLKLDNSVESID